MGDIVWQRRHSRIHPIEMNLDTESCMKKVDALEPWCFFRYTAYY